MGYRTKKVPMSNKETGTLVKITTKFTRGIFKIVFKLDPNSKFSIEPITIYRDLSSSSSCIESRVDQLSRCDRDSDCCSKKCNIFRDSAYHCEPSIQNGVSGTQKTG